jgi:hypothetical protein
MTKELGDVHGAIRITEAMGSGQYEIFLDYDW